MKISRHNFGLDWSQWMGFVLYVSLVALTWVSFVCMVGQEVKDMYPSRPRLICYIYRFGSRHILKIRHRWTKPSSTPSIRHFVSWSVPILLDRFPINICREYDKWHTSPSIQIGIKQTNSVSESRIWNQKKKVNVHARVWWPYIIHISEPKVARDIIWTFTTPPLQWYVD